MSDAAWELLISGSVLVVSCLRIHTNKGQLTGPGFLSAEMQNSQNVAM